MDVSPGSRSMDAAEWPAVSDVGVERCDPHRLRLLGALPEQPRHDPSEFSVRGELLRGELVEAGRSCRHLRQVGRPGRHTGQSRRQLRPVPRRVDADRTQDSKPDRHPLRRGDRVIGQRGLHRDRASRNRSSDRLPVRGDSHGSSSLGGSRSRCLASSQARTCLANAPLARGRDGCSTRREQRPPTPRQPRPRRQERAGWEGRHQRTAGQTRKSPDVKKPGAVAGRERAGIATIDVEPLLLPRVTVAPGLRSGGECDRFEAGQRRSASWLSATLRLGAVHSSGSCSRRRGRTWASWQPASQSSSHGVGQVKALPTALGRRARGGREAIRTSRPRAEREPRQVRIRSRQRSDARSGHRLG